MRIAICDDEKIMRDRLRVCINRYDGKLCCDEYKSGLDLLQSKENYDIIFLDIEMPGIDGMETAKDLRKRNCDARIVFLTSHLEHIQNAFKVRAFRFLSKPVDQEELNETLRETQAEMMSSESIVVSRKGSIDNIPLDKILYFESFGDGSYIYDTDGNVYECSVQLKEWDRQLCEKGFFKIHKSYIVSLAYVNHIENNQLFLNGVQQSFTISRRNLTGFREAYIQDVRQNASLM